MRKAFLIVVLLLFVCNIAQAYFETGNSLFAKVSRQPTGDTHNYSELMSGVGYIVGVFDAYRGEYYYDAPGGLTQGQIVDIAKKYLEEHPEKRHKPAIELLLEAFQEAFPLKKDLSITKNLSPF